MNACSLNPKFHRYGLIGHPIAHSGSPALFRRAYGGKWPYDLIETPSFDEAWERFLDAYDAINITAPFKEKAAARADIKSPEVQSIGAANIAVKTRCGVKVFNSDYLGVRMLLERLTEGMPDKKTDETSGRREEDACDGPLRVLVVGYGGAGKAAAAAARDMGLETTVCNRSDHGLVSVRPLSEIPESGADIVLYTLPMLIPEMETFFARVRKGEIPGPQMLIEANYRDPVFAPAFPDIAFPHPVPDGGKAFPSVPARSVPLPEGCRYTPGEDWLLAQAVTGYEILTGIKPEL